MKKLLILFIVLSFNYSFAGVYTVTNTNDSGVGSLRDGIIAVNSGGTINFTLTYPATIPLSSGEINFGKSIYFDGPGADLLSISGGSSSRLFYITAGDVYSIILQSGMGRKLEDQPMVLELVRSSV